MHKSEFEGIAGVRAFEAKTLLEAGCPSGAMYLCGYAIELALKAVISKGFDANTIPDKKLINSIYVHDLNALVKLAGLEPALEDAKRSSEFEANWEIVKDWSETKRYEIIGLDVAQHFLNAAPNETIGVYPWIASKW
jgi:hypothetical protein